MQYKALLSDVDGTLVPVGPHTVPTKKVVESLKKAKERVTVSLVSGRPINWLTDLFTLLDLTDPCIINGGTQIVNPKTHEVIWQEEMEKTDVEEIMKIIKENHLHFLVNDNGTEYHDESERIYIQPIGIQMQYLRPEDVDQYLQMLEGIPTVAAHRIFSWEKGKNDIYITHRNATKEHAAKQLAKILGIDTSEMIGVGDSGNDLPLLKVCGLKVAMGNATESLKTIADYIAPSLEEDGVAHVVERFILH